MRTSEQNAVLYAAFKLLEKQLKEDGQFDAGTQLDLTGKSVTIKFPPGLIVSRQLGENGNGKCEKRSPQNLYGYAVWALFIDKLLKFKQWKQIKQIILDCVNELVDQKTDKDTFRKVLQDTKPHLVPLIDELAEEMPMCISEQDTPRELINNKLPPTITIKN